MFVAYFMMPTSGGELACAGIEYWTLASYHNVAGPP